MAVAGLTLALNPGARPTHSGFMTIAQLCDHFEQRELSNENTWRSVQGDAGAASAFFVSLHSDVYTQAITPVKHAARAAVILLVFSSDKDGPALVAG